VSGLLSNFVFSGVVQARPMSVLSYLALATPLLVLFRVRRAMQQLGSSAHELQDWLSLEASDGSSSLVGLCKSH